MYRTYLFILLFPLAALFTAGCGNSSSGVAYRPFKTAAIPAHKRIAAVGCNSRFVAVSDSNGSAPVITLYRLTGSGTYEMTDRIAPAPYRYDFTQVIAMSDRYLAVGASDTSQVHLYRLDKEGHAEALTVIENVDKPYYAFGRSIDIDGDRLIIGAMNDGKPQGRPLGKAWLYRIESNGSVTLEHLFPAPDGNATNFGANAVVNGDTVAIGDLRGYRIHLYHIGGDGNVTETAVLSPSAADPGQDYRFRTVLTDKGLLCAAADLPDNAFYFPLKDGKPSGNMIALPAAEGLADELYGRSVAADNKTLLIESGKGVTLYRLDNGVPGAPVALRDEKQTNYDSFAGMQIAGDRFVRNCFNGDVACVYNFYPRDPIYVYNRPALPLRIAEAVPPYNLYCVAAAATDGNLTYTLTGDDAAQFELNGTCLRPVAEFDWGHPADSNGDNDYNQSIVVTDPAGHSVTIRADVRVSAAAYRFAERIAGTQTRPFETAPALWRNEILTGGFGRAELFTHDNGTLTYRRSIPAPNQDALNGFFGEALALGEGRIAVAAPYEDRGDVQSAGAVYLYPDSGTAASLHFSPDDLKERAGFGTTLAMQGSLLAAGAPGDFHTKGALYLYELNTSDGMPQLLTKLESNNTNRFTYKFGSAVAFDAETLLVGEPRYGTREVRYSGRVTRFVRDGNDSRWRPVETLQPPVPRSDRNFGLYLAADNGLTAVAENRGVYIYRTGADGVSRLTATVPCDHTVSGLSMRGTELLVGMYSSVMRITLSADGTLLSRSIIKPLWLDYNDFSFRVALGDGFFVSSADNSEYGALYLYERIRR